MRERDTDPPLDIHITGHSHGGQIARILAELYKDNKNVRFHITTIETPLSIIPPTLMPDNVDTWQHFFHRDDPIAKMGSFLMQAENIMGEDSMASPVTTIAFVSLFLQWFSDMYTRKIKTVFDQLYYDDDTKTMPASWQDHEITLPLKDKHNDPVLDKACADSISEEVIKAHKAKLMENRLSSFTNSSIKY